jgi:hypothetical protein
MRWPVWPFFVYVSTETSYRPQCVDCGMDSPMTNTNYTLISQTGWRLTRVQQKDTVAMEWRCPSCWARMRGQTKDKDKDGKGRRDSVPFGGLFRGRKP